jgi:hypothetical protein
LSEVERKLTNLENQRMPTFPRKPPPPVGILSQLLVGDDDTMYSFDGTNWTDCNA